MGRQHELLVFHLEGSAPFPLAARETSSEKWLLQRLSGVVESGLRSGTYSLQDSLEPSPLEEWLEPTGSWYGLFKNDRLDEWLVIADYFGMSQVHYGLASVDDRGYVLVIGDSHRAVSSELYKYEQNTAVNWNHMIPYLASGSAAFNMRYSDRSPSREIRVLHQDKSIRVGADGFVVESRPIAESKSSYEQTLAL